MLTVLKFKMSVLIKADLKLAQEYLACGYMKEQCIDKFNIQYPVVLNGKIDTATEGWDIEIIQNEGTL